MWADAITGASTGVPPAAGESTTAPQSADGDSATATSFSVDGLTLFDSSGASVLTITPSQSIDLFAPREKLRGTGSGGQWYAADGGALLPDGVLAGLGSGVSASSIGNVGFSAGGGATVTSGGTYGIAPTATPEPSTLFLLGSGLAFAVRRLRRDPGAERLRERRTALM